ncbi:ankyrin [Tilletiopsis washingtonensis]|uniref:Ankyrin n=1 Tax=Tilletiopsis washingtonensis TaxID=58919 RepID=A0A316ZF10_9BASI|nr:ankyrin [Tilletiopsis washingtonensis]PWN99624.1 ankyrin [Tilletiopsis washingtonensis]
MSDADGASPNEQLLHACTTDAVALFEACISLPGLDVNCRNGLGLTPLHLAIQNASTQVLEVLLEEEVDVDIKTRQGDTPLHLAVRVEEEEVREWIVQQLLEAGADPRERNKNKDRPQEVIVNAGSEAGQRLRSMLREAEGRIALGGADVADDSDDE